MPDGYEKAVVQVRQTPPLFYVGLTNVQVYLDKRNGTYNGKNPRDVIVLYAFLAQTPLEISEYLTRLHRIKSTLTSTEEGTEIGIRESEETRTRMNEERAALNMRTEIFEESVINLEDIVGVSRRE